jgi:hypothetical protein
MPASGNNVKKKNNSPCVPSEQNEPATYFLKSKAKNKLVCYIIINPILLIRSIKLHVINFTQYLRTLVNLLWELVFLSNLMKNGDYVHHVTQYIFFFKHLLGRAKLW